MAITIPDLDPRDEETLVADTIDALPSELSDRNEANPEIQLINAVGAMYAVIAYLLNQQLERMWLVVLDLLGIDQTAATFATTPLTVVTSDAANIPVGTEVKTGPNVDDIVFVTTEELDEAAGGTFSVEATAEVAGAAGNVGADTLTTFDPITNVTSITNDEAATGGADEETLAQLLARAPLAVRAFERAITDTDFVAFAEAVAGVGRALYAGHGASVSPHIIADDLNARYFADPTNATDEALRDAVQEDLEGRSHRGLVITPVQFGYRLFVLTEVEVELEEEAGPAEVNEDIREAMRDYVTIFQRLAEDGVTVNGEAWAKGAKLYANTVRSIISRVDGVIRVETLKYQVSDDYGDTWETEATLSTLVNPGMAGADNTDYGLLQWGEDYYDAYALTLVEL